MNVKKLKGKLVENDMNVEMLAAKVGMGRLSMYRKLANIEKITVGEAARIKAAVPLTDEEAYEIFLT